MSIFVCVVTHYGSNESFEFFCENNCLFFYEFGLMSLCLHKSFYNYKKVINGLLVE